MRKSKEIIEQLQSIVNEFEGLRGIHIAVDESHLIKKIKDFYEVQICMIMPETHFKGDLSNRNYRSSMWLFVVEKSIDDNDQASELEQYNKLEKITHDLLEKIFDTADEGCNIFCNFEPSNLAIMPEYNIFGGFNGWSFNIVL